MEKLKAEINEKIVKPFSKTGKFKDVNCIEVITPDLLEDMVYLRGCFLESMRLAHAVPLSVPFTVKADTTIKQGYTFLQNEVIYFHN